jgi:uncharacterized protein YceK
MKLILVILTLAALSALTGCASNSSLQQSVNSIMYNSEGGVKTDHYQYGGPYQFKVRASD